MSSTISSHSTTWNTTRNTRRPIRFAPSSHYSQRVRKGTFSGRSGRAAARHSRSGGQHPVDCALVQPAGRQFRHVVRGQIRKPLLPQSGHAPRKSARTDHGHPPHLRQRVQPRRAVLSPPHGPVGLRRTHGDLVTGGAGPVVSSPLLPGAGGCGVGRAPIV